MIWIRVMCIRAIASKHKQCASGHCLVGTSSYNLDLIWQYLTVNYILVCRGERRISVVLAKFMNFTSAATVQEKQHNLLKLNAKFLFEVDIRRQ